MQRMMVRSLSLSLPLFLLTSLPVAAQSLDWHVGLGVAAELDGRAPGFDPQIDAEEAATLFVGATFENGFGFEAAYVDLGNITASGIADGGFDLDGELWSVGATYRIQLDQLEPYAKLGWFSREEDGVAITIAGPVPLSLDDDGLMGEVGLRWRITQPFALRLGYAWYDFEPDSDGSAQFAAEWHF